MIMVLVGSSYGVYAISNDGGHSNRERTETKGSAGRRRGTAISSSLYVACSRELLPITCRISCFIYFQTLLIPVLKCPHSGMYKERLTKRLSSASHLGAIGIRLHRLSFVARIGRFLRFVR